LTITRQALDKALKQQLFNTPKAGYYHKGKAAAVNPHTAAFPLYRTYSKRLKLLFLLAVLFPHPFYSECR
jgi:hypothetical protein